MGQRSQYQIQMKQREKRKKARKKLTQKGRNLEDYYYGAYYLKSGSQ